MDYFIRIVLCFIFFCIRDAPGSFLQYDFPPANFLQHHLIRVRRQDQDCKFKCGGNTTECISSDNVCNGNVDCSNGNDESNSCSRIRCPGYLFRCEYGACINKNLVCDGRKDCRDGSDETGENCAKEFSQPSDCTTEEFRCANGQCIDAEGKCNGKVDCADQSDETPDTCSRTICPGYTFRCTYGACVNKRAKCNGVKECVDGSDEDPVLCGETITSSPPVKPVTPEPVTEPPKSGSCRIPEFPSHGRLVIPVNESIILKPGENVNPSTVIIEKCNKGFAYDGDKQYMLCLFGQWTRELGQCKQICDPVMNTTKMTITCTRNNIPISCEDPIDNTVAAFKCAPYYEDLSLKRFPTRICRDGTWNQHKPNCVPECGLKNVKVKKLILGGKPAAKGDYPWQVALYRQKNSEEQVLVCGGSLINQRVVLTAAHCIANDEGDLKPIERYTVAVGKYYRDFNNSEDTEAQYSKIKEIFKRSDYRGYSFKYYADIAIIVTETSFELGPNVLPVCIDWGENYDNQLSTSGTMGIVTGWGLTTAGGDPSNELKEIVVPYIVETTCKSTLPVKYEVFITPDKMCSGYHNEGLGVCEGDSGGGLVFLNDEDNRYYIRGIVSLSPQKDDSCDPNQYALYTKVSYHITFINSKEVIYREL